MPRKAEDPVEVVVHDCDGGLRAALPDEEAGAEPCGQGPLLGLLTYPVVVAIGAALLAGARFRRWFWLGPTPARCSARASACG